MIQIDMDMPEVCACCPFLGDTLGKVKSKRTRQHFYCTLTGYVMPYIDVDIKRHSHCPLKEVKKDEKTIKMAYWIDKSCWEFGGKFKQCIYQCSNCGYEVRHDPFSRGDGRGGKYCDDCGAKMSKEKTDENN